MSIRHALTLTPVSGTYAVCRLAANEAIPESLTTARFAAIARTADELSIVCPDELAPAGASVERGWRCLRVAGPLPFSATGIMASLVAPLAEAAIPIFAISTFDTDYLLVKEGDWSRALQVLVAAGHALR
jgi:hypothetical protein